MEVSAPVFVASCEVRTAVRTTSAPPTPAIVVPPAVPPPSEPPAVKKRGRPKKTDEEKARDKAKRLLEKATGQKKATPKAAVPKAKTAVSSIKKSKAASDDEMDEFDDRGEGENEEMFVEQEEVFEEREEVDPDLVREKRRPIIRPLCRVVAAPTTSSVAGAAAVAGSDDDDDDDDDDTIPAWFTAIFNEDLGALKRAISSNPEWMEETHYQNFRPNQVWTAMGFAVERDFADGVRILLSAGGVHLANESFTLDDGPITPLQLAKV